MYNNFVIDCIDFNEQEVKGHSKRKFNLNDVRIKACTHVFHGHAYKHISTDTQYSWL